MQDFNFITTKLRELGIEFEEVHFSDQAISARHTDSSQNHNYNPANAIKTLLIETKQGIQAVVLRGVDQIDTQKLKNLVGRWSVVSRDKLGQELQLVAGGICPLTLEYAMLIDERALELPTWSMGAGALNKGVNISQAQVLSALTNYQIINISK